MTPLDHDAEFAGWDAPRPAGPIPLARFREEILQLYVPPLRAKATYIQLRHALDVVAELLGEGATTAGFTPGLIARVIATRPPGQAANTTKSLLSNIRAACGYAKMQGYIRSSPFDYRRHWIRVPATPAKKHHSQEDLARVLALLAREVESREGWPRWRARRLQALAATVAYTGLRKNEALELHVSDVDLDRRMILLVERTRRMKTANSSQPVPMPEPLAAILRGWLGHVADRPESSHPAPPDCPYLFPGVTRTGPWRFGPPGSRPLDQLKAAGERAGVEGLTFLSLRHSYATHAESWGMSPAMIQRILRHTSVRTQQHYRHADEANMRAAVADVRFDRGEGGHEEA